MASDSWSDTDIPRLLQVVAGPEDTPDTLSFYSEPIMASLSNIITPPDEKEKEKGTSLSKDYTFLEVELKYGILQPKGKSQEAAPVTSWDIDSAGDLVWGDILS
ncbi:hypothetical protein O3P69_005916 [Scylla paramamosain]|uniref:Uncharacterized protein n=1 Tax=Scylla paramamosain TaxID=85552 RepID=A0AAW0U7N1_SCYPA